MLLFELIIGRNKIFRERYEKLDYDTQEKVYMFFFFIEGLLLWTLVICKIIKG